MRSPAAALLWEIWRRHRGTVAAIGTLTVAGWLVDVSERGFGSTRSSAEPNPLTSLLAMLSFLLLCSIFNYTESSDSHGLGRFPRRLFTLPVSSLKLVAVPMLAGIAAIELLHLAWMEPLSRGGETSSLLVGVLLGTFMVSYQTVLWTLDSLRSLRLVVIGVIGVTLFGISLFPTLPAVAPRWMRSEAIVVAAVIVVGSFVVVLATAHVARLRAGGVRRLRLLDAVLTGVADALPSRRSTFASPAAAQFWFEWRTSGLALPVLVAGVIVVVIAPLSWLMRGAASETVRLLVGTLATPIIFAIPVGMAFAKPTFWSEDLSVPAFVAVRPLRAEDVVAIKAAVAALSVVVSWLVVLAFLVIWLPLWAHLESLSRLAIQMWAFYGRSVWPVYGIAALVVIAGMFLTWRFMVVRLWSGLSGSRRLFVASVISVVFAAVAGTAFDAGQLPGWILENPRRVTLAVWILAVVVIAKYSLAAYAWRRVSRRYVRQYLPVWLAGTTCFVALGLVFWGTARIGVASDDYRVPGLLILVALLAVPLARLAVAPSALARNRHR
jgi:hypothetical protein